MNGTSFGPWSTAINTGAPQQLDTFWKRRLAMLPSLSRTESRATRRTLVFLGIMAVAALAIPTMKWTTHMQSAGPAGAFADDTQPADAGKGTSGADRREKPGSAGKGRKASMEVEYLPRPSKFEEQVLESLEKPTTVEFVGMALEDCIQFLREVADIPMWMDKQTLTDEGVALDQPITLKLKGARLESVLNLLLKPVQLAYLPEDDVVVITTTSKAAENLITRTYPVRDLYQGRVEVDAVEPAPKAGEPAQQTEKAAASNIKGGGFFQLGTTKFDAPENDNQLAQGFGGGGGGMGGGAGKAGAAAGAKPAPPAKRHTDLVDAITNTIEPDSWEDQGGPGTYTYVQETGCLVVLQTWAVHRKILQLLRDLREAKHLAPGGKALPPVGDVKR
jgi:hypothetical protein